MSVRPVGVVALLLLVAFTFQGTRGLWEPDEGRYVDVALQMQQSGDWLTPRLNQEERHYTKPPLTYWAVAASLSAFGRDEWAVRTPVALAFIVTGLAVWWLGVHLVPGRATLAVILWASTLAPVLAANLVSTDTLLAMWETLAMACLVQALHGAPQRASAWVTLMWALFGLGFLTKGPPALLPLLGVLPVVLAGCDAGARPRLSRPLDLLLFAALGLSWFAWSVVREPALARYFLEVEILRRVADPSMDRNAEWYGALAVYAPALLLGGLPWSVMLLRRVSRLSALASSAFWRTAPQDRAGPMIAAWFLVPLAVFCLSRSRLPLYVLPLFVPVSLQAARWLAPSRRFVAWTMAWLVLLVTAKGLAGYVDSERDSRRLAALLRPLIGASMPEQLVFVDARPWYGLSFYLGAEVHRVATAGGASSALVPIDPAPQLCGEIAALERRVYLARPAVVQAFEAAARRCHGRPGYELRRLGTAGSFVVLRPRAHGGPPSAGGAGS